MAYDSPLAPPASLDADELSSPVRRLLLFVGPALAGEPELVTTLGRAGWRCLWLADADAALRAASHAQFDAVVLRAEGEGGPPSRVIDALRRQLSCPVLVVAETADEVDEVIALELGADGWLAGPLSARRLRAHLQALMRPRDAEAPRDADTVPVGPWTLDLAAQRLERHERRVGLTGLQACLLRCLAEQAGRVVSRDALAGALGGERALHARSVDVYIARLRRRLRDARVEGVSIEGVRGRGYTLDVVGEHSATGLRWPWVGRGTAGAALPAAA